jgi:hypothetical protein
VAADIDADDLLIVEVEYRPEITLDPNGVDYLSVIRRDLVYFVSGQARVKRVLLKNANRLLGRGTVRV